MGRKVLLHLCALWSEGPPRQVGCVKLAALVHLSRAVRLRVCHVWDKKLALISHKKAANRIDPFVMLVVGDGQHLPWVIWALNLGGPFLCITLKRNWLRDLDTRG